MEFVGILWDCATRLFSICNVHAAYVYKLEKNLASLHEKCEELRNRSTDVVRRIGEAERPGVRERTEEVKGWLQQVEYIRKVTMKGIQDQSPQETQVVLEDMQDQGSQQINNKCGCWPKNCNWSGYKLGKNVVKTLNNVDDLLTKGMRFDSVDVTFMLPSNRANEMPLVHSKSLDSAFKQIWNSIEDENMGIIGLFGMGGVGKTTLLKRIHNELGMKHGFDIVLWVVVSRDCDINKIMDDIHNELGIDDNTWGKSSQDQKAAKIYEVLKQKKFVLMLDDLWREVELQEIGVPYPKKTNNQSRVFFTTRYEDVCDKMEAEKSFKVECLSKQEAIDLFCEKVGEATLKCHTEIPKLAKEMAEECRGLPLALITIGRAMSGVKLVETWRKAIKDLKGSSWAPDSELKVFSKLKFSYDKLPDETHKKCFLYCALYPEDYEIDVDDLIDRWIGERFLGEDKSSESVYDMHEQGKSVIEKLKLSCLLEDVEYNDGTHGWWQSLVKMHDVIRDMALWLVRDQDENKDKVLVEGEALAIPEMDNERLNVVENISIINSRRNFEVPVCPNLLTLCIQARGMDITDYSNLQFMIRLKVLDLSGSLTAPSYNLNFPIEISKLINLEFLKLSRRSISNRLPIEMKNLKKLRVLILVSAYGLDLIPLEVIESLKQLMVFRFRTMGAEANSDVEEAILEKLESLPKLEELSIQLKTITGMHKLLKSTKLRGCSRRFFVYGIEETLEMRPVVSSLSLMKHLEGITLFRIWNIMEGSSITDRCHLQQLRWVHIYACHSITHLTWLRYAPLLEFLHVGSCHSIKEVVKEVVQDEEGVSELDRENSCEIFPNLKRLFLIHLPELEGIYKRALAFPRLKFILVKKCPNLMKLPLNSSSARDSLVEIKGETKWWNSLEWEDTDTDFILSSKFQPEDDE